jgi:tetratricopeptide (TPR) repeat protein
MILICFFTINISSESPDSYEWENLSNKACELFIKGEHLEAIKVQFEALETSKKMYGDSDASTAVCYRNLGTFHFYLKKIDKAEQYYLESIKIDKTLALEPDDVSHYASTLTDLADLYVYKKQYEKAESVYSQALEAFEKKHGKDDAMYVAPTLKQLSIVYKKLGDKKKSKEFESRWKSIFKNDNKYEELYMKRNRLTQKGKYLEAIEVGKQLVSFAEKIKGKDSIDVGFDSQGLADLYLKVHDFKNAEIYYNKSLKLHEKYYGKDHHGLEELYKPMIIVYSKLNKHDKKKKIEERLNKLQQ